MANYSIKMYGATATATQKWVGTHLLAAPLSQPHQCEQVHLTQWNPIDSGTVTTAVAAPCEQTFTPVNRSCMVHTQSNLEHNVNFTFYE